MKSVLIPIQPYWVFLIIARKMGWDIPQNKTVEIRKNYPKENSWNKKAIIYCTQDKKSFYRIPKEYQGSMRPLLGKAIGEFVCDRIIPIAYTSDGFADVVDCETSCMAPKDFLNYGKGKPLYSWHISSLKIYDEPKELKRFGRFECEYCGSKKECFAPETIYYCSLQRIDIRLNNNMYRCDGDFLSLKRPPQSWCYVEELK